MSDSISILYTLRSIRVLIWQILLNGIYGFFTKLTGYESSIYNLRSPFPDEKDTNDDELCHKIVNAVDISDMAKIYGYISREHVVRTEDGYLLVVHKIESASFHDRKSNGQIVYFHHGLLTNSELFLLGGEKRRILPFLLVDLGYEVWLGNNRGNKYSRKHVRLSASDPAFWNFSLDEYALYDIPNTINYISDFYGNGEKITYIGFSQGCSQLLASLSLRPELNSKLKLFVGLSPAVIPRNLNHPLFKIIVKQAAKDNMFLYSFFGKRAILPSVVFWSSFLGSVLYERIVDISLTYLFGWSVKNISGMQKKIGYPHMFSNSSVKSLIHWFQIIDSQRFQMFDETGNIGNSSLSTSFSCSKQKSHRVPPFPIAHHLDLPMLLFHGDLDILVDIDSTYNLIISSNEKMKSSIIDTICCTNYEHMDTLWADDVYERVFEKIIDTLETKQ